MSQTFSILHLQIEFYICDNFPKTTLWRLVFPAVFRKNRAKQRYQVCCQFRQFYNFILQIISIFLKISQKMFPTSKKVISANLWRLSVILTTGKNLWEEICRRKEFITATALCLAWPAAAER